MFFAVITGNLRVFKRLHIMAEKGFIMILSMQHFQIKKNKHKEFLQTWKSLVERIRKEKGCLNCNMYKGMTSQNVLMILTKWKTREELDKHLHSKNFNILKGAINLLGELSKSSFIVHTPADESENVSGWDLEELITLESRSYASKGDRLFQV